MTAAADALLDANRQLRERLRDYAVVERMAPSAADPGRPAVSGWACELCARPIADDRRQGHAPHCLLAEPEDAHG